MKSILDHDYNPRQKSGDTKYIIPYPTFNVDNLLIFPHFDGGNAIFSNIN